MIAPIDIEKGDIVSYELGTDTICRVERKGKIVYKSNYDVSNLQQLTDKRKLDIAVNQATTIIFLNQQWIAHLRKLLEAAYEMSPLLDDFIKHAQNENRKAFEYINSLNK